MFGDGGEDTQVLINHLIPHMSPAPVQITRAKLRCMMAAGGWLNDEVINLCMGLLQVGGGVSVAGEEWCGGSSLASTTDNKLTPPHLTTTTTPYTEA